MLRRWGPASAKQLVCFAPTAVRSKITKTVSENQLLKPEAKKTVQLYESPAPLNFYTVTACASEFIVALRPSRPYGLLGTGSPGRPPRLSHSSWALFFSIALRPQRLYWLLGTGAQDGHLDFHTAPEFWSLRVLWRPQIERMRSPMFHHAACLSADRDWRRRDVVLDIKGRQWSALTAKGVDIRCVLVNALLSSTKQAEVKTGRLVRFVVFFCSPPPPPPTRNNSSSTFFLGGGGEWGGGGRQGCIGIALSIFPGFVLTSSKPPITVLLSLF